jgi:hypothetical protein
MPIDTQIEFPQADVDAMFAQMERARKELGKSFKDSLQWGGALLVRSLAASTKQIPKSQLRPIVRNPDERWKTDRRRAPFGVMKYHNGKQVFLPIFRGGEFGRNRFYDPRTMSWFERFGPQKNTWRKVASGPDPGNPEIIVPGIMTDKRRQIPRKGFAKRSWGWLGRQMRNGGSISVDGVPDLGHVRWSGGTADPTVHILNKVKYADKALKGGKMAIETAFARASQAMLGRINRLVEKERFGGK